MSRVSNENLHYEGSDPYDTGWVHTLNLVHNRALSPRHIDLLQIEDGHFPSIMPKEVLLRFLSPTLNQSKDVVQLAADFVREGFLGDEAKAKARQSNRSIREKLNLDNLRDSTTEQPRSVQLIRDISTQVESGGKGEQILESLTRDEVHTVLDHLWCAGFIDPNPIQLQKVAVRSHHPLIEPLERNILAQAYDAISTIERDSKGEFIEQLVDHSDKTTLRVRTALAVFPNFNNLVRGAFLHPEQLTDQIDPDIDRNILTTIFYAHTVLGLPLMECAKRLNLDEDRTLEICNAALSGFQFVYNTQLWKRGLVAQPFYFEPIERDALQLLPRNVKEVVNVSDTHPASSDTEVTDIVNALTTLTTEQRDFIRLSPFRSQVLLRALQGEEIAEMEYLRERDQKFVAESAEILSAKELKKREYILCAAAINRVAVAHLIYSENGRRVMTQFINHQLSEGDNPLNMLFSTLQPYGFAGLERSLALFVGGYPFEDCIKPMLDHYIASHQADLKELLTTIISASEWIASGVPDPLTHSRKPFVLSRLIEQIRRGLAHSEAYKSVQFDRDPLKTLISYDVPLAIRIAEPKEIQPPYSVSILTKGIPLDELNRTAVAIFANLSEADMDRFNLTPQKHNLMLLLLSGDPHLDEWLRSIRFPWVDGVVQLRDQMVTSLYKVSPYEPEFVERVFTWLIVLRERKDGWLSNKLDNTPQLVGSIAVEWGLRWYKQLSPQQKDAFIELCLTPYCAGESFTEVIQKRKGELRKHFNITPKTLYRVIVQIAKRSDQILFDEMESLRGNRNVIDYLPMRRFIKSRLELLLTGRTLGEHEKAKAKKKESSLSPLLSRDEGLKLKSKLLRIPRSELLAAGVSPFRLEIYVRVLEGYNPFETLSGAKNATAFESCQRFLANKYRPRDSDKRAVLRLASELIANSDHGYQKFVQNLTLLIDTNSEDRNGARWLLELMRENEPIFRKLLFNMYSEGSSIVDIFKRIESVGGELDLTPSTAFKYLSSIISRLDFYISDLDPIEIGNVQSFNMRWFDELLKKDFSMLTTHTKSRLPTQDPVLVKAPHGNRKRRGRRGIVADPLVESDQPIPLVTESLEIIGTAVEDTLKITPEFEPDLLTSTSEDSILAQEVDIEEKISFVEPEEGVLSFIEQVRAMIKEKRFEGKFQIPEINFDLEQVLLQMISNRVGNQVVAHSKDLQHSYTIFLSPFEVELFDQVASIVERNKKLNIETSEVARLTVVAGLYNRVNNSIGDILHLDYPSTTLRVDDDSDYTNPLIEQSLTHTRLTETQFSLLCREHHYDPEITEERLRTIENEISIRNFGLVTSTVRKKFSRYGFGRAELVTFGNPGLLKAIRTVNPTLGYNFSTYAIGWIRLSIELETKNHRTTIRVPVHIHKQMIRLREVLESAQRYSEGSDEWYRYIATEMEINIPPKLRVAGPADRFKFIRRKIDELVEIQSRADTISPDSYVDDGEREIYDVLGDPTQDTAVQASEAVDMEMLQEALAEILDGLDPRTRLVIELRYGMGEYEPLTLDETAKKIVKVKAKNDDDTLSRERVRQLEKRGLEYIKKRLMVIGVWDFVKRHLNLSEPQHTSDETSPA